MTETLAPGTTGCPLCGNQHHAAYRAHLLRCTRCEFIVDPAIWTAGAAEALEREFFEENIDTSKNSWQRLFERWSNARTLRRLRDAGAHEGTLLDVGVGSGALLAHMRDNGFVVEGCEISPVLARHVRELGIVVHEMPLDELPAGKQYDVITLNHVLEHVTDPIALLDDACTRLRPGGVLHVALPNAGSWDAYLAGWTSYQPYHLGYFTPRTLRLAAERAGLRIRSIVTFEPFSGWFLAIVRSLMGAGLQGWDNGATTRPAPAALRVGVTEHAYRLTMLATGALLTPVRAVQGRLGFGEEIVMLASKEA